jgi:hypothetical protein
MKGRLVAPDQQGLDPRGTCADVGEEPIRGGGGGGGEVARAGARAEEAALAAGIEHGEEHGGREAVFREPGGLGRGIRRQEGVDLGILVGGGHEEKSAVQASVASPIDTS